MSRRSSTPSTSKRSSHSSQSQGLEHLPDSLDRARSRRSTEQRSESTTADRPDHPSTTSSATRAAHQQWLTRSGRRGNTRVSWWARRWSTDERRVPPCRSRRLAAWRQASFWRVVRCRSRATGRSREWAGGRIPIAESGRVGPTGDLAPDQSRDGVEDLSEGAVMARRYGSTSSSLASQGAGYGARVIGRRRVGRNGTSIAVPRGLEARISDAETGHRVTNVAAWQERRLSDGPRAVAPCGTGRALADGRRYRRARPRPNRRFFTAKTRRRLAALKLTERAALSALDAARRQPPRRSTVMHWFGSELAVQSR